jgi:hypothetical protein
MRYESYEFVEFDGQDYRSFDFKNQNMRITGESRHIALLKSFHERGAKVIVRPTDMPVKNYFKLLFFNYLNFSQKPLPCEIRQVIMCRSQLIVRPT